MVKKNSKKINSPKNDVIIQDKIRLKKNKYSDSIRVRDIRTSSLEIISYEIYLRGIPGSTAELGVYRGDFAKYINFFFPDRKLYLFDTFSGFSEKDIEYEIQNKYSDGNQDFSDTSVELIINKMPFKDNIIIKKGWFPKSAKDINDIFCFINIDVDLYKPTYNALKFFYPKLSKGGYIFVHDFNFSLYTKGVREAVIKFCEEIDISYFPLTDACGSVVLMK